MGRGTVGNFIKYFIFNEFSKFIQFYSAHLPKRTHSYNEEHFDLSFDILLVINIHVQSTPEVGLM